jgi:hypothetical protein
MLQRLAPGLLRAAAAAGSAGAAPASFATSAAAAAAAAAGAAGTAPGGPNAAAAAAGPSSSSSGAPPPIHARRAMHTTALPSSPQYGGYMSTGRGAFVGDPNPSAIKYLITGACGQIGAELVPFLRTQ